MNPDVEVRCVEKALRDHQSRLIGYIISILHNQEKARDVVQEAFVTLVKKRCCCALKNPRAWLFKVCRNNAYKVLKTEIRRKEEELPQDIEDERKDLPEKAQETHEAVDHLPRRQREVIHLLYFEGMSPSEVAEILGHKVNNVYQLRYAGLASLKKSLESRSPGGTVKNLLSKA